MCAPSPAWRAGRPPVAAKPINKIPIAGRPGLVLACGGMPRAQARGATAQALEACSDLPGQPKLLARLVRASAPAKNSAGTLISRLGLSAARECALHCRKRPCASIFHLFVG